MSRYRRPYCPGLAFHVTTRLTGHALLFDAPTRIEMLHVLAESSCRSDVELLAYALMENHLHLVVRQREDPISRLLQPSLRRIALLIRKKCGVEGHVFERRFRAKPCLTALHLRDTIVYTHLNPVRRGLCDRPEAGHCTSHSIYAGVANAGDPLAARTTPALALFATHPLDDGAAWHAGYSAYVAYRLRCDREDAMGAHRSEWAPDLWAGDAFFAANFASAFGRSEEPPRRIDLRDIARCAIQAADPNIHVDMLRGPHLPSRQLQKIRSRIIREAAAGGHSGVAIAAFFTISPSRVSCISRQCG